MDDLCDLLSECGIEWSSTHHHSREGWVQLKECPFCHSQNYHLGITHDAKRGNCYRCGYHSPYEIFESLRIPYAKLRKIQPRFDLPSAKLVGRYLPPTCLVELEESSKALRYLSERNLDPTYCKEVWKLQATSWASNYPHRLFIPIMRGTIPISWTARALHPEQTPRYQTASAQERSFDPKQLLFGSHLAGDAVVVVEGPMDAITIGKGAVALLGLNYSVSQVKLLAKYRKRAILLDSETAAQKKANQLAEELCVFPGETLVLCLDSGKDANAATEREIRQVRQLILGTPEKR